MVTERMICCGRTSGARSMCRRGFMPLAWMPDRWRIPSPIGVGTIVATTQAAMSRYALDVAPAEALENIASATGMLVLARRRLRRFWPELAATLTA